MKSFSKLVKAAERLHEFNFRQLTGAEKKYHVDVPDSRGNRIVFSMLKDGGDHWRVSEQLPEWIHQVEADLSQAIDQQEAVWITGRKS